MFYGFLYQLRRVSLDPGIGENFACWLFTELKKHWLKGVMAQDCRSRDGVELLWRIKCNIMNLEEMFVKLEYGCGRWEG